MSTHICHIDDCQKPVRGWGLCGTHWARWRKWGDPYWVEPKRGVKPPNFKHDVCQLENCDRPHHAHGYCARHVSAFRKHGNPLTRGNPGRKRKAILTNSGAHKRVTYDRGPARDYECVDCGAQAEEWSLRHDASPTNLQRGPVSNGTAESIVTWSVNSQDYAPRCIKCHRRYDNEYRRRQVQDA